MPSFGSETGNVLYLIVCGAPPTADTAALVEEKQAEGWDVCVIATAEGLKWLDRSLIESLTGHPLRSEFRAPNDAEFEPRGDAVLLAPATFNTVNKWALGISDTLAMGLLNEALGRSIPIQAVVAANTALRTHPALARSLSVLRDCGVKIE